MVRVVGVCAISPDLPDVKTLLFLQQPGLTAKWERKPGIEPILAEQPASTTQDVTARSATQGFRL